MIKKFKPVVFFPALLLILVLVLCPGCAKAMMSISILDLEPDKVAVNAATTISVDIANTGNAEGTYLATLNIDGNLAEEKSVTIAAEGSEKVSFEVTKEEPGSYEIDVNGLTATLNVLRPAAFKVANMTVSPTEVLSGWDTPITVSVEISNTGEMAGEYEAALSINGTGTEAKTVTVAPSATEKVEFTLVKDEGGAYNLAVGDATGTFSVKEGVFDNLHIGDKWVYEYVLKGVTYTLTEMVTGEETVDGVDCYVLTQTYDPNLEGKVSKIVKWQSKKDRQPVKQTLTNMVDGWGVTQDEDIVYTRTGNNPWVLSVGNTWSEITTINYHLSIYWLSENETEKYGPFTHTVDRIETVKTKAGEFRAFHLAIGSASIWYSDKAKTFVKYQSSGLQFELFSYDVQAGN
jgi:hypothetical protein